MHKKRKILAGFLTFSLIFTQLLLPVSADNATNSAESADTVTSNTSAADNSLDYLTAKDALNYSGEPIIINASEFAGAADSSAALGSFADQDNVLTLDGDSGLVEWTVDCPEAALYQVQLEYAAYDDSENTIEIALYTNGQIQHELAESMILPRLWVDETAIETDDFNNQSTPKQVQRADWQTKYLTDTDGLYLEPIRFYLEAGVNKIGVNLYSGKIALSKIVLSGYEAPKSYEELSKEYATYSDYKGENIVIEAQNAITKSSKELRPISDKSDPSSTPSSAFNTCINAIGGSNWDSTGERITWKFEVKESALYTINFKYMQSYLTNASSIRKLEIDDEVLFSEAAEISFPYATTWSILTAGGDNPYKFYLEEGEHTISLTVTLGEIAEISRKLEKLIFDVGELYREIIMITGTSPDANRDYRLYQQVPSLNERLEEYSKTIDALVAEYDAITGVEGGSNAVTLKSLGLVLDRMRATKFSAHEYVSDLFNQYSSAGAWVYEMRLMALDLEKIIISGEKESFDNYRSNFFERFIFGCKKLIASFTVDYNNISGDKGEEAIEVWVNLGRDQAKILTQMIDDTFTPQTGIKVNIKIATASMIQARLSGMAPDCTIMQGRDLPVNLAMRGALYSMSEFDDFEEAVMERYGRLDIVTPYTYKGKVYGMPDTETFPLMFVRDDVFEQLGLEIPTTWDEFLGCSSILMRNNLSVGVPEGMYTTFLYQFGGTLYNEDLTATNLQTTEAFAAFEYYTDLYAEYKLPVAFSLYNRFRTGEMPLGIATYTEYATLMAAASEIRGSWSVHPVPGIIGEDGEFNGSVVGGGSAAVILNNTKHPKEAWEFIKWWTGDEAQFRYSSDIESIVGIAARNPTANREALQRLSWGRNDIKTIISQYERVVDTPETPGSYYLTRSINNAFYSVYSDKENPKEMLIKWATMTDEEITRKIKEYS